MIRTLAIAVTAGATFASAALAAPMGMTFVSHDKVENYAKWRAFFDANADGRTKAGLTDCAVQKTILDPNEFVITCAMADVAKAKAAITDKAFLARLGKAGIVKREVLFLKAPE